MNRINIPADLPVEDVKQRILTELTRDFDKLTSFAVGYEIFTTAEFAQPDQIDYTGGVAIRPNRYVGFFIIGIFSPAAGAATGGMTNYPWPIFFGIYAVAGYLIYRMTPSFHRELVVDHQGISINKDRYEWTNIIGTFILKINSTKGTGYDLLLIDRGGEIHRHGAGGYSISEQRIATLIEYYRNQAAITQL